MAHGRHFGRGSGRRVWCLAGWADRVGCGVAGGGGWGGGQGRAGLAGWGVGRWAWWVEAAGRVGVAGRVGLGRAGGGGGWCVRSYSPKGSSYGGVKNALRNRVG